MNKLNLPYNRQYIDNDDINAVVKALKSDLYSVYKKAFFSNFMVKMTFFDHNLTMF